jgi:hypothetical protein
VSKIRTAAKKDLYLHASTENVTIAAFLPGQSIMRRKIDFLKGVSVKKTQYTIREK